MASDIRATAIKADVGKMARSPTIGAVNNLGSHHIGSVYDEVVATDDSATHLSFNGGQRGTAARPSEHAQRVAGGHHVGATADQQKQFELAAMDRALYSKLNGGEPDVLATQRAGIFTGPGVTKRGVQANQPAQFSEVATGANAKSLGIPATASGLAELPMTK